MSNGATNILALPMELLSDIFLYLEPEVLVQTAISCQSFHAVLQGSFWYQYCNIHIRKYQGHDFSVDFESSESFYKQVIHPFKDLRGYFARQSEPPGTLLWVEWNQNKIIGYDIKAPGPPRVDGAPRKTELFRILLGKDNKAVTLCSCNNSRTVHNASVKHVSGSHNGGDCVIIFSCKEYDNVLLKESVKELESAGRSFEYRQIHWWEFRDGTYC